MDKIKLEELQGMDLFGNLSRETLESLKKNGFKIKLKKNEFLFMEREEVDKVYIVLKGKVTLYKSTEEGQTRVVYILNEGEIINEVIFDTLPASIHCKGFENSEILYFHREELLNIMEVDFELTKKIIYSMGKKIRRLYRQIKNTVPIKIDKRVAAKLWKLSKDYGKEVESGTLIDLNFTITYLADMLGSSRETISRCLKQFEDKNLLCYQDKKIVIINRKELSIYFRGV